MIFWPSVMPSPISASNSCMEFALAFGELDHLALAEGEILLEDRARGAPRRIDVGGADAELRALPAIEVAGVAAHRLVAVLLDVVEHGPHAVAERTVVLARFGLGLLEILDHGHASFLGRFLLGDAAARTFMLRGETAERQRVAAPYLPHWPSRAIVLAEGNARGAHDGSDAPDRAGG